MAKPAKGKMFAKTTTNPRTGRKIKVSYGQAGVERALSQYKAELQRDMKLMGCTKISDLNRNNLRFR